jgi:hypothetical protein
MTVRESGAVRRAGPPLGKTGSLLGKTGPLLGKTGSLLGKTGKGDGRGAGAARCAIQERKAR